MMCIQLLQDAYTVVGGRATQEAKAEDTESTENLENIRFFLCVLCDYNW